MNQTDPHHSPRKRPSILIIDPDAMNRDISSTILRHAGFRVLEAEDAEAGLRLARTTRPTLIVTELFKRTETGWYILERLAGADETAEIPVVAYSAYALKSDREAACHAGATRYLAKPLPPQELKAAVEALLSTIHRRESDWE